MTYKILPEKTHFHAKHSIYLNNSLILTTLALQVILSVVGLLRGKILLDKK